MKIMLSDEYRRLLSWKTYGRVIKDEGQDDADYKIDHNEVKMRRIKGRDGDGEMCFEYLNVDVSRLQTIDKKNREKFLGSRRSPTTPTTG